MSYKMTTKKDGDILLVQVSGQRTYENVSAAAREIMDLCRKMGTLKALIDVQALKGKLNTFDAFRLASIYFKELRDRTVLQQAAVIDQKKAEKRYTFLETVAVNRGYNIRFFNSIDKALQWLNTH